MTMTTVDDCTKRLLLKLSEVHLFTNESSEVNEDGLTEEEEREIAMALLNGEDDTGLDEEDLIAMAMDID